MTTHAFVEISEEALVAVAGGKGMGLDPNGGTTTTASGDEGVSIDPNG